MSEPTPQPSETSSTRRRCRTCLFYEGMRFFQLRTTLPESLRDQVTVGDDGRCSVCRAYAESFDPEGMRRDLNRLLEGGKGAPVLVAVSGGKDSLSTLYAATKQLGLGVVAVLFDNGFIPVEVVEQTQRVCERLGAPLRIASFSDGGAAGEFRRLVAQSTPEGPSPCHLCSKQISRALEDAANEVGASWVVYGTNFFTHWDKRPWARAFRTLPGGGVLHHINLPYALGITREATLRNLAELGAKRHRLPGVSSNCRVPALTERRVAAGLGHIPELEILSLEVIVGHLPRAEAMEELGLPLEVV